MTLRFNNIFGCFVFCFYFFFFLIKYVIFIILCLILLCFYNHFPILQHFWFVSFLFSLFLFPNQTWTFHPLALQHFSCVVSLVLLNLIYLYRYKQSIHLF